MEQKYIAGLDVGGTSIKWSVFTVGGSEVSVLPTAEGSLPTGKGNPAFLNSVRDAVDLAAHYVENMPLAAVGVCLPGRFVGPDHGIAAPHTAHNLCEADNPTCFDNQPLKQMLQEVMPDGLPLFADNDAVVQMVGLLQAPDINRMYEIGDMAGYIGPGTGLGGGFARKVEPALYHPVTDGHINHVLIHLDPADAEMVAEREARYGVQFPGRDGLYTAEGLFSGTALEKLCGLQPDTARQLDEDADLRAAHGEDILLAGRILAAIVTTLHSGHFEKLNPDDTWPAEDQAYAAEVTKFLFAGGVGQSRHLGPKIQQEATRVLQEKGLSHLQLVRTGKNPAARAAANMALAALQAKAA